MTAGGEEKYGEIGTDWERLGETKRETARGKEKHDEIGRDRKR